MKILFITQYVALFGANKSLLSILNAVKNAGDEPWVLCPEQGDLTLELKNLNIGYTVFNFHSSCIGGKIRGSLKAIKNIFSDISNFSKLKTAVFTINPDLIYTNTSVVYHGYFLARALNKPHIWHLREFGWEDYHLRHPLGLSFFKTLLYKSDGVICISRVISIFFGQQKNTNAKVIYNGIKVKELLPVTKNVSADSSIKFLIVGFISESKGQLEAIKAFEKLLTIDQRFELVIVGEGSPAYFSLIKSYCHKSELLRTKVLFTGFQKDPSQLYNSCHYFLMYSKSEAFGRVTVEAMQHGMPVIAKNSAGSVEIVKHDYNGYLFDDYENSLTSLYDKLRNNSAYIKLSQHALETKQDFSEEKYTQAVIAMIYNVYQQKSI